MAFILEDILRLPGKLLRRVAKVKKRSWRMMLSRSGTTWGSAWRGRRGKKANRRHRTGEGLRWPKPVLVLGRTVLAPLKLVRRAVNKVRRRVDAETAKESRSAGGSASRDRPEKPGRPPGTSTSSDQR